MKTFLKIVSMAVFAVFFFSSASKTVYPKPEKITEITVSVNYDLPLSKLSKKLNFTTLPANIDDKYASEKNRHRGGTKEVKIEIVKFDKEVSLENIVKAVESSGYRMASIKELVSLTGNCSNLDTGFVVLTVGSKSFLSKWHSLAWLTENNGKTTVTLIEVKKCNITDVYFATVSLK